LRNLVSQVEVNKNVDLEVLRDGKPMKVTTQIKEQPADYLTRAPRQQNPQLQPQPGDENNDEDNAPPQPQGPQNGGSGGLAAIQVGNLTPDLAKQLDLPNGIRGVVVTDASAAGGVGELRKGDVIEEVNQQPVPTAADYNKVMSAVDRDQPLVLSVCRHRVRSFVVVRPR
jgi:serine protease Do